MSAVVEVQGVTIANTNTPSRIRPLSAPSVSGDPIQFRRVRHAPVDVGGVIFLFGTIARDLGCDFECDVEWVPALRSDAARVMPVTLFN